MSEVTLSISGMSCGDCAARVEQTLLALEGVQVVRASCVLAQAVVSYDPAIIEPSIVKEATEQLGYAVAEVRGDAAAEVGGARRSRIILVSTVGDNHRTASFIAQSLGIEELAAGLLPEDKANRIKALKRKNYTLAMVGDGINDAPALATADAGIAMGVVGSDIAMQAANVALLTDDLAQVSATLALGRKTLSVIRHNLVFALLFNTAMILLASCGHISMVVGAVCHQGSSLFVILNSMRLLASMKPGGGALDEP